MNSCSLRDPQTGVPFSPRDLHYIFAHVVQHFFRRHVFWTINTHFFPKVSKIDLTGLSNGGLVLYFAWFGHGLVKHWFVVFFFERKGQTFTILGVPEINIFPTFSRFVSGFVFRTQLFIIFLCFVCHWVRFSVRMGLVSRAGKATKNTTNMKFPWLTPHAADP